MCGLCLAVVVANLSSMYKGYIMKLFFLRMLLLMFIEFDVLGLHHVVVPTVVCLILMTERDSIKLLLLVHLSLIIVAVVL